MKKEFKKDNFSNITTEDLIKKKKSTTFAFGVFLGVLAGLLIITIFQTINKGITPLLAVPFAFLPLLVLIYKQVGSMDKELKSRNSK